LSQDLGDEELEILRENGLSARCSHAFAAWSARNLGDAQARENYMKDRNAERKTKLICQDAAKLQIVFLQAAVDQAVKTFP
jgi:hypothetical protein